MCTSTLLTLNLQHSRCRGDLTDAHKQSLTDQCAQTFPHERTNVPMSGALQLLLVGKSFTNRHLREYMFTSWTLFSSRLELGSLDVWSLDKAVRRVEPPRRFGGTNMNRRWSRRQFTTDCSANRHETVHILVLVLVLVLLLLQLLLLLLLLLITIIVPRPPTYLRWSPTSTSPTPPEACYFGVQGCGVWGCGVW